LLEILSKIPSHSFQNSWKILFRNFLLVDDFSRPEIYFLFTKKCTPLNRITLGQHKSDNNNRMIQFTSPTFFVQYSGILWDKCIWLLLSAIQLSGGQCTIISIYFTQGLQKYTNALKPYWYGKTRPNIRAMKTQKVLKIDLKRSKVQSVKMFVRWESKIWTNFTISWQPY